MMSPTRQATQILVKTLCLAGCAASRRLESLNLPEVERWQLVRPHPALPVVNVTLSYEAGVLRGEMVPLAVCQYVLYREIGRASCRERV